MKEMHFETTNPDCELFLSSEGVGFLMLSASSDSLRKWQGLTVADVSICAGVRWAFEFKGQRHTLLPGHWRYTERDTSTITRHFETNFGLWFVERWDWGQPDEGLKVTLSTGEDHEVKSAIDDMSISVTPLWTLSPAGYPSCGGIDATLSLHPASPGEIQIQAQLLDIPVKIKCQKVSLDDSPLKAGEWQILPDAQPERIPTPKDACRGEQFEREVLLTHECTLGLKMGEKAQLVFSFENSSEEHKRNIVRVSDQVSLDCESESLKTAFTNCAESLNQLIRSRADGRLGLQAGLPWFTQFWTRDMCHSFRAAFLWSGRFADGQALITDLWMQTKGRSIPNYTTTQTTTNNSIDALPLLLLTTADLVDHTGWTALMETSLPEIEHRLLEAARVFASNDLIRHGPADTWMDAQKHTSLGVQIACSPRADRAFEIQAFWISALHRWSELLGKKGNIQLNATLANAAARGLSTLRRLYLGTDGKSWADTLRPDNTPDFSLRPNILLGLSALHRADCLLKLMSHSELQKCLENLIEMNVIMPYGVRTLSPETSVRHSLPINELFDDESAYIHENKIHFHPYHEFGSRHGLEHPDWAYHNGTIWPWLSNSACELLLIAGLNEPAEQLRNTLVFHANQGLQGGALPELLDGLSSHSPWSWPKGAPHQAWSEAAFIHMVVEEWMGIRIVNIGKTLQLDSSKWKGFPDFSFEFTVQNGKIQINKYGQTSRIQFTAKESGALLEVVHRMNPAAEEPLQIYKLNRSEPLILKLCFS